MNRRNLLELLPLLLLFAMLGCFGQEEPDCPHPKEPPRTPGRVSIQQGIWGNVWFWSGNNFMPFCETGTITPVVREIEVHPITPSDSATYVDGSGGFFSEVRTPIVTTIQSDAMGFFEVSLPIGQYSLFVREDSLLYANQVDGYGNIWPVSVVGDSVTEARFDITYEMYW